MVAEQPSDFTFNFARDIGDNDNNGSMELSINLWRTPETQQGSRSSSFVAARHRREQCGKLVAAPLFQERKRASESWTG